MQMNNGKLPSMLPVPRAHSAGKSLQSDIFHIIQQTCRAQRDSLGLLFKLQVVRPHFCMLASTDTEYRNWIEDRERGASPNSDQTVKCGIKYDQH